MGGGKAEQKEPYLLAGAANKRSFGKADVGTRKNNRARVAKGIKKEREKFQAPTKNGKKE